MSRIYISSIFVIFTINLMTGCTTATMTGRSFPPVDPAHVKILFSEKPNCVYQELAFINSPLSWNQNRAISHARDKAAEIGADYLVITYVYLNLFNDASVNGIAYKCGRVDRDKVDIKQP